MDWHAGMILQSSSFRKVLIYIMTSQAPAVSLSELFMDTAPFILAPRLIISIWDTHAHSECAHVSTTFEDCVCWTLPQISEEHEMDSEIVV
jgi:hypothetical protein